MLLLSDLKATATLFMAILILHILQRQKTTDNIYISYIEEGLYFLSVNVSCRDSSVGRASD